MVEPTRLVLLFMRWQRWRNSERQRRTGNSMKHSDLFFIVYTALRFIHRIWRCVFEGLGTDPVRECIILRLVVVHLEICILNQALQQSAMASLCSPSRWLTLMQFGDFYVMEELPQTETLNRIYSQIGNIPFTLPKGSLPVVLPCSNSYWCHIMVISKVWVLPATVNFVFYFYQ